MPANYGMGPTTLQTTKAIERTLFAFAGAALYNAVELSIAVLMRFRLRKGLYFWSLIVATLGIFPYTFGLLFKFFGVMKGYPTVLGAIALVDVGWQCMVTGQSVVLYSRLHLICKRQKVLRAVLCMIIINWFISNVPTTVFVFGASSANPEPYAKPYDIWERVQMSLYFVQELIISGLYIYEVRYMLQDQPRAGARARKRSEGSSIFSAHGIGRRWRTTTSRAVLKHLVLINLLIVTLDISLLVTEYIGHYEIQVVYKALVYSTKLKLEFKILNELTNIASAKMRSSQAYFDGFDGPQSMGSEAVSPLCTHESATIPRRMSDQSVLSPGQPPTHTSPNQTEKFICLDEEVRVSDEVDAAEKGSGGRRSSDWKNPELPVHPPVARIVSFREKDLSRVT